MTENLDRNTTCDMKISVLIVAANQKDMLCETLESLLQQSYDNMEIIIVDDASTDGTLETVEAIYGDRENICYLCNDTMQGLSASYNLGAGCATGTLLAFADCGTKWHPDRLQKQTAMWQEGGYWNYCTVTAGGQMFPGAEWEEYKRRGMLMPSLFMDNQISLQGVLVDKTCFDNLGGFDENLPAQQEYDFLLRLSESYYGEEVQGNLVYGISKSIQPEYYVAADAYLLMKYAGWLQRFGLKKEKLIQVMDNAGYLGKMGVFWEYTDFLLGDTEYASALEEYIDKHNLVRRLENCEGDTIQGVKHCTGCAVCVDICPVGAICMQYDEGGFAVPHIDDKKCVHCGKCVRHCPTQIDLQGDFRQQICYALQAQDIYRDKGSSGGMFPLLAEYVLAQGGYVAGAVFDKDFAVEHIVSNRREDVVRMYGSKYVQSSLQGIYGKVKELLKRGEMVLFSGVACQTAALRAYLGQDYEKLYTIDVVCHGVPSPGAWKSYLKELVEKGGSISGIGFRDKKRFGWQSGLYVDYEDGSEISDKKDAYIRGFLNNWILRDSCYQCNFKAESYSDITLGDFWGIAAIDETYDNRGTSYVTVNSAKGEGLLRSVRGQLAVCKVFPSNMAVRQNRCIEKAVLDNRMHGMLKSTWKDGRWKRAVEEIYAKLHFDVALVCLLGINYGNTITNYALYRTLEKFGSVILVDTGVTRLRDKFLEFVQKHFLCSSEFYPRGEWDALQQNCDTFLVGSDQVWNTKYAEESNWGTFFQLGFVGEAKRKVSYASSFGQQGLEPSSEQMCRLYQDFWRISVREEFGVEVCRRRYHMDAACVLDPVFLLRTEEYDELLEETGYGEVAFEEPFIVAYLLSPTVTKREFCEKVQSRLGGIKIVYMIDNAKENRDLYRHILQFENVKVELSVEEWLGYLRRAQCIITDSFHGTCFSVIFHKPFLSFVNRQSDRFQFFQKLPGMSEHILNKVDMEYCDNILEQIDYAAVEEILQKEREISLQWLEETLRA